MRKSRDLVGKRFDEGSEVTDLFNYIKRFHVCEVTVKPLCISYGTSKVGETGSLRFGSLNKFPLLILTGVPKAISNKWGRRQTLVLINFY